MFRRSFHFLAVVGSGKSLDADGFGRTKRTTGSKFSDLWWKPETKDERVKEYVPEVIEESLKEQQALLEQTTLRDELVEHGQKVMNALENKAPTPSIAPSLNRILEIYGSKGVINQRTMSYLLSPNSSSLGRLNASRSTQARGTPELVHELVSQFGENMTALIQAIEQDGRYVDTVLGGTKHVHGEELAPPPQLEAGGEKSDEESATKTNEGENSTSTDEEGGSSNPRDQFDTEPPEVTYFVKCISGMGLANMQCNELKSAVKCCDAALDHVIDESRKGGVLGLKAGILLKDRQLEAAAATALLAVETSNNVQGYLHGATALRLLKRDDDALELLQAGASSFPQHDGLSLLLEKLEGEMEEKKLALGTGGEGNNSNDDQRLEEGNKDAEKPQLEEK